MERVTLWAKRADLCLRLVVTVAPFSIFSAIGQLMPNFSHAKIIVVIKKKVTQRRCCIWGTSIEEPGGTTKNKRSQWSA
jgi:hypothetical protein